ncbi:MAG TPA: hypothetical protein VF120_07795 [Ktedonobacterales bacterium]
MMPTIEVLYVTGCPNVEKTVALLYDVLRAKGLEATPIDRILVETEARAERLNFHGSPTVRIDGQDVAPLPSGAAPGLACRLYRAPEGHLIPHPPVDALVAALELSPRLFR